MHNFQHVALEAEFMPDQGVVLAVHAYGPRRSRTDVILSLSLDPLGLWTVVYTTKPQRVD